MAAVEQPKPVDDSGFLPFTVPHFKWWARRCVLDDGEPFETEVFQDAFLEDVFAGFTICWLIVPEGCGKTTLVASIALYHSEHREFASVPVAAATREQAGLIYRQAEGFVLRTPHLHEMGESIVAIRKGKRTTAAPLFDCLEGYRRINCTNGSRIQVFASDEGHADGVLFTLGIIDELHRAKDLGLFRVWSGKTGKRGGQLLVISTAGEPGSEFEVTRTKMRTEAREITREGCFTRAAGLDYVLHDWAVPEGGDLMDFDLVAGANPLSTITPETLAAKWDSPGMTLEHWSRLTCNVPTRSAQAAVTEAEWDAGGVDVEIPEGEPIWAGLDVAWKYDTTSLVPLWWRDDEWRQLGKAEILIPPRNGNSLDPDLVEAAILRVHERNPIHTVVMDTSKAEQLAEWIRTEIGAEVVDRTQSNPMAVLDYARWMEAMRKGWLKHSRDAGLTRHVLNAVAKTLPQGDIRFERASGVRRSRNQERLVIDALTAASMVHMVASADDDEPPGEILAAYA